MSSWLHPCIVLAFLSILLSRAPVMDRTFPQNPYAKVQNAAYGGFESRDPFSHFPLGGKSRYYTLPDLYLIIHCVAAEPPSQSL